MTFSDTNLLPISALNHFIFCQRRCALVHLEKQWTENRFTSEGRLMHKKVDNAGPELRDSVRVERGIALVSRELGLIGKSDVVEFHSPPAEVVEGAEIPYPVEYKRGRPKPDHSDFVQLTAQALCLEEMTGASVPEGAIFYGQSRRRMIVLIDSALRGETEHLAQRLHQFIQAGKTPAPNYGKRCEKCSLLDICMPKTCSEGKRVSRYISRMTIDAGENDPW